ncbi:hypothetical protein [Streptomyces diacarni]|uniref:hypothetical protein n=1 Tax=Streptomyces diacarni TaxID=2800381 RepID=UPI0011C05B33|nr:hypothetical protein [Streptomyces diacarni]
MIVGFQKWMGKDNRSLCGGIIREDAAKDLLGDEELQTERVGNGGSIGSQGRLAECKVIGEGGRRLATISIGTAASAPGVVTQSGHNRLDTTSASAPLGGEWPGVLTVEGATLARATTVLECHSEGPDHLLVNVNSTLADTDTYFTKSSQERLRVARAATIVSKQADRKWGCHAKLGKAIEQAPAVPALNDPKPLSSATGTCRSLRRVAPAAKAFGITRAVGTASTTESPTQDCLLVNAKGEEVYRLSALHGPLAKGFPAARIIAHVPGEAGRDEDTPGWAWSKAQCPSTRSASLFTAASIGFPNDEGRLTVDGDFERELLDAFGSDLAKQHGCEPPALP